MHVEYGYAAVDDLHAVVAHDVGDGSAAACIYLAQLDNLELNIGIVHYFAKSADVFSIGIIGAALAP